MIRIITKRHPVSGVPEEWADYPAKSIYDVPLRLGIRFDSELMALKLDGIDFYGVRRWSAAVAAVERFQAEAKDKMVEVLGLPAGIDVDLSAQEPTREQAAEYAAWQADHPAFSMMQAVTVWAAVNLGGGRIALGEVLDLPPVDVIEFEEIPDFIESEGKGAAGS